MQRKINRTVKIDSFSLSTKELKVFLDILQEQYRENDKISISINCNFHEEIITFNSVDEMITEIKNDKFQYDESKNFSIFVSKSYRENRIQLLCGEQAEFTSESDNLAWCEGVNAVAHGYLKRRRNWYYFLYRKWMWEMFMFIVFICSWIVSVYFVDIFFITESPTVLNLITDHPSDQWTFLAFLWLILLPSLLWAVVLSRIRSKFFPYGVLYFHKRQAPYPQWISAILGIVGPLSAFGLLLWNIFK